MSSLAQALAQTDDSREICCPHCKSEYTHQRETIVRRRRGEDGPGVRVAVDGAGNAASAELGADAAEWAGRRNDVAILLDCEDCEGRSVLLVQQHKGQTLVVVRPMGAGESA